MRNNLLTREKTAQLPTLRKAFGLLFICGILARVFGLIREVLIAQLFGVSEGLDTVYLALSIPMALTVGVGSGLTRAVVPVAAGLKLQRFAGLVRGGTRRVTFKLLIVAGLLIVTAPLWTMLLTWGENTYSRSLLIGAAMLGSLALCAVGPAGIIGGAVNSRGNHTTSSISPLIYNALVCFLLYILSPSIGVMALPVSILAGEFSQIAVHWTALKGMIPAKAEPIHNSDWSELKSKLWPSVIVASLVGLNVSIDRMFATWLETGSIAALTYADKLVNLPAGLLGVALAVPLYTRLSHFKAQGNREAFRRTLLLGLRLMILGGVPAAVFLFWTSESIIGLLLQRGAFDLQAVQFTQTAFQGYALGIAFIASAHLLTSAALTLDRPMIIVWMVLLSSIVNILLDWWFMNLFGLLGLAFATSVVAIVRASLMLQVIAPEILRSRQLWLPVIRISIWGGIMFVALGVTLPYIDILNTSLWVDRILTLIASVVVCGVVTALLWKFLLKEEWEDIGRERKRVAYAKGTIE